MIFPYFVGDAEPLARFALESNKIRTSSNTAKFNLFMPARDNVLSVFRCLQLSAEEIFELGKKYGPQGKPVLAYAEVAAGEVRQEQLELVPTAEPHPRHVDVVGWTDDATNRHRAHVLANKARVVLASVL